MNNSHGLLFMGLQINFNFISMIFGAGVTGLGVRYYSMYPLNELLAIIVMGVLIWVMSFIMYRDTQKESKEN